jgi:hypothetical protein
MLIPSYHTRRPLEALSSSCGMVSRFAAVLLRIRPVRSPAPPPSARAACPALPPDVDADVCRCGDGLHSCSRSFEQAYLADGPSAVHKCTLKLPVLSSRRGYFHRHPPRMESQIGVDRYLDTESATLRLDGRLADCFVQATSNELDVTAGNWAQ